MSLGEDDVELDVRLVHIRVSGDPLRRIDIKEGCLELHPKPLQERLIEEHDYSQRYVQKIPRFDSEDSDLSDLGGVAEDYLDSFIW